MMQVLEHDNNKQNSQHRKIILIETCNSNLSFLTFIQSFGKYYMLLKPEIQKLFASSHGTMELVKILEIFSQ